jgi:hypothetical protein
VWEKLRWFSEDMRDGFGDEWQRLSYATDGYGKWKGYAHHSHEQF